MLKYVNSVNEEAVKWPERTQIMEARSWFLNSWAYISSHFSVTMLSYSWLIQWIDVDCKLTSVSCQTGSVKLKGTHNSWILNK